MKLKFVTLFAYFVSIYSVVAPIECCNVKIEIDHAQQFSGSALVLVNGKHVLNFQNLSTNEESIEVPIGWIFSSEGNNSIAVYDIQPTLSLIGLKNVFISLKDYTNCMKQTNGQNGSIRNKRSSPVGHSIGLQYSVWHGFAANAVFKMQKLGAHIKTVETLITEGSSIDDYWSHGIKESDSVNGYYQVQPKRG